jgi:hypothetical protein
VVLVKKETATHLPTEMATVLKLLRRTAVRFPVLWLPHQLLLLRRD